MPWTGPNFIRNNGPSPIFTGANCWDDDAAASILIESARHDYHDQDLAQGINACLNKNGANSPIADINWGGFKITNQGAGVSTTDGATFGQTITAASLDTGTNILTLSRSIGGDISVDLTPLVVGGSTSNFAKLNASDNVFVGQAEFGGTLQCWGALALVDVFQVSPGIPTWAMQAIGSSSLSITDTAGANFNFSGNSGIARITINGNQVWDQGSLTPTQVANFLLANTNANITGSWNFYNGNITLPAATTFGTPTGGGWTTSNTGTVFQLFANANGDVFKLDHDSVEGQRAFVNGNRVWSAANLSVISSATPTGGSNGDLAVVLTGANQGLWSKVSGTWTKIIAGP